MNTLTPPDEIQELFRPLLADFYSFKYNGKPVKFLLAKNEHTYLYFEDKKGNLHCYTPHPSTDGDYFVWDYIPHGKGARSGKATQYTMKNIVRCAHRNTAKNKALARYKKAANHE